MNVLKFNHCNVTKPCFTIYENVFTDEECDKICELQIDKPLISDDNQNPIIGNFKNLTDFYHYEKCLLGDTTDLEKTVMAYIFDCNSKVYGYEIWGMEEDISLLTFKNNSFIDYHERFLWFSNEPNDRKLSAYVFLTDPQYYIGGKIKVDESLPISSLNQRYSNRGNLLVFPSFITHEITPITSGVMQILTFDIIGPKLR